MNANIVSAVENEPSCRTGTPISIVQTNNNITVLELSVEVDQAGDYIKALKTGAPDTPRGEGAPVWEISDLCTPRNNRVEIVRLVLYRIYPLYYKWPQYVQLAGAHNLRPTNPRETYAVSALRINFQRILQTSRPLYLATTSDIYCGGRHNKSVCVRMDDYRREAFLSSLEAINGPSHLLIFAKPQKTDVFNS